MRDQMTKPVFFQGDRAVQVFLGGVRSHGQIFHGLLAKPGAKGGNKPVH